MKEEYRRFTVNQRSQHIVLIVTFILLVATGLPLKYYDTWGERWITAWGGLVTVRSVHKWAAIGMMALGIWHVFFYLLIDRGRKKIMPEKKDVSDFVKFMKYNLGVSEEKPVYSRFAFWQKFDYWGAFWGFAIMIGAGAVMWWPEVFNFLPLWATESLRMAHSEEAVLAAVFVFTIHIYSSHLRSEVFPLDKVFITGKISKERMMEDHPLEYEGIKKEV